MSTRSSWYYDGPIHVWHDVRDGRCYVCFHEDTHGNVYPLWRWTARALCWALHLTGREARYEVAHATLCLQLNQARRDAIRTAIRDLERNAGDAVWAPRAITALNKTAQRWIEDQT